MKLSTLFVFLLCAAIVDWSDFDFSEEESDGLAVPNRHNRRVCNVEALQLSLGSGRYPEFLGVVRGDLLVLRALSEVDFLFASLLPARGTYAPTNIGPSSRILIRTCDTALP